jgi:Fe2+ or Zn2+ uptake regulation protein
MNFQPQLKSLGLSVTPVRLAVLEALTHNPHSEASQVYDVVQEKISTTSIQAVYKNLNTLVQHGLVREIKPKGMSSLYETRVGDNHHHLVCRSCGAIEDTGCKDSPPCLTSTDPKGFSIDEAEIVFWGTCPSCKTKHNLK